MQDHYIARMQSTLPKNKTATPSTKTPAPIQKIDLSAFAVPKANGKSEYPILPDASGETAKLVDSICEKAEQMEALEGALKSEKAELVQRAKQHYFKVNEGKLEVPTSIMAEGTERKALVVMQNKYSACEDENAVQGIMGAANFSEFMGQSFSLKIDGDAIPEASKAKLVQELLELFTKHNAAAAITAKSEIKPKASFHIARHSKLTAQQSLGFDKFCRMQAMVKTKGIK